MNKKEKKFNIEKYSWHHKKKQKKKTMLMMMGLESREERKKYYYGLHSSRSYASREIKISIDEFLL